MFAFDEERDVMTNRDNDGLTALLELHRPLLRAYCAKFCQNPHDREDLEQLVMIRVWHGFGRFDQRSRFSTWLYSIVRNTAATEHGRRFRQPLPAGLIRDDDSMNPGVPGAAPEEIVILRDDLERAVDTIGQPFREAFELIEVRGVPQSEAAMACGVTEATIRTRLWRAKQALRTTLTEDAA